MGSSGVLSARRATNVGALTGTLNFGGKIANAETVQPAATTLNYFIRAK